ncbi:hypothetical protein HDU86_003047 [Geranomyces michiganensis]|nr:hypothetical protein HDU86_003047 [Geranomyces michiganensis]
MSAEFGLKPGWNKHGHKSGVRQTYVKRSGNFWQVAVRFYIKNIGYGCSPKQFPRRDEEEPPRHIWDTLAKATMTANALIDEQKDAEEVDAAIQDVNVSLTSYKDISRLRVSFRDTQRTMVSQSEFSLRELNDRQRELALL